MAVERDVRRGPNGGRPSRPARGVMGLVFRNGSGSGCGGRSGEYEDTGGLARRQGGGFGRTVVGTRAREVVRAASRAL
eukprot:11203556-Lingulodinium_polyedra.AAC.1